MQKYENIRKTFSSKITQQDWVSILCMYHLLLGPHIL